MSLPVLLCLVLDWVGVGVRLDLISGFLNFDFLFLVFSIFFLSFFLLFFLGGGGGRRGGGRRKCCLFVCLLFAHLNSL